MRNRANHLLFYFRVDISGLRLYMCLKRKHHLIIANEMKSQNQPDSIRQGGRERGKIQNDVNPTKSI